MEYYLHPQTLAANPRLSLTHDEFDDLASAHKALSSALYLEQTYDLVISNHEELELSVFEISLKSMIFSHHTHENFYTDTCLINRRMQNLLSAAKLYIDHLPQSSKGLQINHSELRELASEIYDTSLHYRFMEALRNHAQHFGLPVDGVIFSDSRSEESDYAHMELLTIPYVLKSKLAENNKFKKSVLNEIPEKTSLMIAMRSYVSSLSLIHKKARSLSLQTIEKSTDLIESAIKTYGEALEKDPILLFAVTNDQSKPLMKVPLNLAWEQHRLELIKKTRFTSHLEKRYVTTNYLSPNALKQTK